MAPLESIAQLLNTTRRRGKLLLQFEFSGDGLDDEDETPIVFLQKNPVFMARNVCVTLPRICH